MKLLEKISILNNELTIYGEYNNQLFDANEIAKIIENKNVSQMLKNVDDDEKFLEDFKTENGKIIRKWYLTEDGIYEVLFQSRSQIAKSFKKEIKKIIKEIRNKGGYILINKNDNEESIKNRINLILEEALKEKNILEKKIFSYEKFLSDGKELISIDFLANKYNMSRKEFISLMKTRGLFYEKGKNIYLYRKYKFKGLAKYFKNGEKNIIKFTLKGEKEINDLINVEGENNE